MSDRPLRLDHAIRALPESGVLAELREVLLELSRPQRASAGDAAAEFATLDQREADLDSLEKRIPGIAERVRERTERVLTHSLAALRAERGGDHAEAARELIAAGEVLERARELEEAGRFYDQAISLGRKPRDRRPEGLAHCRRARVHRTLGAAGEALASYRAGWRIAEASNDPDVMVLACTGSGNVHVDRGEWKAARECYERGLEVLGERTPTRAHWELYSNLAIVARRSGSLAAGEGWLLRAEVAVAALDDASGRLYLEHGRGQLHLARGDTPQAEAAFRRALAVTEDAATRSVILTNLAEALLLDGRIDEAEAVTRTAEETALGAREMTVLPEVYRLLGRVAGERGRQDGFVFFEQALSLLAAEAAPGEIALTQHHYGMFEARRREIEAAQARLEEAITLYERVGAALEAERARADLEEIRSTYAAGERLSNGNET